MTEPTKKQLADRLAKLENKVEKLRFRIKKLEKPEPRILPLRGRRRREII